MRNTNVEISSTFVLFSNGGSEGIRKERSDGIAQRSGASRVVNNHFCDNLGWHTNRRKRKSSSPCVNCFLLRPKGCRQPLAIEGYNRNSQGRPLGWRKRRTQGFSSLSHQKRPTLLQVQVRWRKGCECGQTLGNRRRGQNVPFNCF